MAETLLTAVVLLAGFVVVSVLAAHGKARAFEHGQVHRVAKRPPDAVSGVELPAPHFNERDVNQSRRETG